MSPPPARTRFESPRILTVDRFATQRVCDWVVAKGRPRLAAAEVYDPTSGERLRSTAVRSNSVVSFDITRYDVVLMLLRSRIAALA